MEEYWVILGDGYPSDTDIVDTSSRTLEQAISVGINEGVESFFVQLHTINRGFLEFDCHWKFNVIDGQAVKEYERPWEIFRTTSDW